MLHPHDGILLTIKEGTTDIYNKTDAMGRKPNTREYRLYPSTYMMFQKRQNYSILTRNIPPGGGGGN